MSTDEGKMRKVIFISLFMVFFFSSCFKGEQEKRIGDLKDYISDNEDKLEYIVSNHFDDFGGFSLTCQEYIYSLLKLYVDNNACSNDDECRTLGIECSYCPKSYNEKAACEIEKFQEKANKCILEENKCDVNTTCGEGKSQCVKNRCIWD